MANRWKPNLTENDVTPESAFLNRRQLIAGAADRTYRDGKCQGG